ncbi:MAG: hypothetical protein ACHQ6T_15440 [Myxococcota bacterium]
MDPSLDRAPRGPLRRAIERVDVGLILILGIPATYLATFGLFLFAIGDKDWDQMLTFQRIALWGLALSGGRKEWNPVMAGGMSLAGEPQTGVFSLSMILSRVVPPVAALKIAACCFLAAGWAGTYALARRYRFSERTAMLAASLFAGNGYILARLATGHLKFDAALCLPLWLLGCSASLRRQDEPPSEAIRRLLVLSLSFGVLFALSCDGAPFSILLVVVWIGLDAVLLAAQRRSVRPMAFLLLALATGALLDAIYVFPMVNNSFYFPRLKHAKFVDPLVFPFFLLVPTLGHPLRAPAMGHEFSVYIGPVLAALLFRYRRGLLAAVPREDRHRLIAASALALVLGFGSLRPLWASAPPLPFDLLSALPGFRTIDLPARFWGFLALPLALFGALAIHRFEAEQMPVSLRRAVSAALLVSLLGYQAYVLSQPFLTGGGGSVVPEVQPPEKIDRIANVLEPIGSQAATILPTRGLIHAYADYVRGEIAPGSELIREAVDPSGRPVSAIARWHGWNDIQVALAERSAAAHIVFNQNYHPFWRSSVGTVSRTASGNLVLDLPASPGPVQLAVSFRDPYSALGQRVTRWTAGLLFALFFLLLLGRAFRAGRSRSHLGGSADSSRAGSIGRGLGR